METLVLSNDQVKIPFGGGGEEGGQGWPCAVRVGVGLGGLES